MHLCPFRTQKSGWSLWATLPPVGVLLLAAQCHLVSPTQSLSSPGMVPAMGICSLLFLRMAVQSLSSATPQQRTDKSVCTSRQGQICLFFSSKLIHYLYTEVIGAQGNIPIECATGVMISGGRWSRELGSAATSVLLTPLIKSSKFALGHTSDWGPVVPSVLSVTLGISPGVLQLGSGAAFSFWVTWISMH